MKRERRSRSQPPAFGIANRTCAPDCAVPRDRNTPGVGAEDLARFAQHVADRVLRILHVLQVARQPIEEPQRVEFSFRDSMAERPIL